MSTRPPPAWLAPLAGALLLASGCGGAGTQGGARPSSIDPAASPASLVALADSATREGDANLARRALERASEIAPADPEVRLAYGRYYVALRRYADAKTEFERAASLDPRSPEPHFQLGIAYLEAGERTEGHRSLVRALRLDPDHAGALAAIRPILEERYRAAGIPPEYAELPARSTISRGELGVMLAVELGVDPDRVTWREDAVRRTDWPALDAAWGSRWLRASVARGWITPLADRDLHLDDPLSRGALAILVSEIVARSPAAAPDSAALASFPDLGPRHYLALAAGRAAGLGLPARGERFEPQALATGSETLSVVRGLARRLHALPVVSHEP